jgi:diguanylate cyclase (GGDEF)-like protein
MDRLGRTIEHSRRYDQYLFAVLFLDLDRFKVVNDSLGHSIGDLLLKEIGKTLKTCLRAGDTVARLGGDEFVILLEDIQDVTHATKVTERILDLLSKPFLVGNHQVFTSASIGIVLSTIGYVSTEEVLRDADIAMYQAKMMGKAKYVIFDKEMRSQVVTKLKLENDLRVALDHQEFDIYYQPIISIGNNSIAGFEALLRWHHPELGLIAPASFIPIAEETGMILEIGQWVLEKACRQVIKWQKDTGIRNLNLSINISYRQFCHPNFLKLIRETLRLTQFDPYCLNLEITENILMDNSAETRQLMSQLRELGISIHIDDFGTGYSSLSYLQRFPINTLKIDRSFINQLGENGENAEIVRTILVLAHELGVDCIAEGIETRSQLEQLRRLNCNFGQGFFIGRPLASEQIFMLLKKQVEEKNPIELLFPLNTGKLKLLGQDRQP